VQDVTWRAHLKLLHLTNFYHPKSGGIKTYLDAKSREFKRRGIHMYHVFPGPEDTVEHPDENTTIYRVRAPEAHVNGSYRIIWDVAAVTQVIMRVRPDIIEVNDKYTLPYPPFFARLLGRKMKVVGFIHDRLDDILHQYWRPAWFARIMARTTMRIITSCFDRIICASEFVADELRPFAYEKADVINLGVDIDALHPHEPDHELRAGLCPNGEPLLLYAGRLAREKNVSLLPKVVRELEQRGTQARLAVAGQGPEKNLIGELGSDRVHFFDYIHDTQRLGKLFSTADVLLFPSLREPYGLVPLEALACGCPVVCVNQGGTAEYSGSESVQAVPGTPAAFADAVEAHLFSDDELLRKKARMHALSFSWEKTVDKQLALYEALLSNR